MMRSLKTSTTARMPGVTENPTSPKHLRGRAISPKAPRPQTQTTADTDHRTGQKYGTLHGRQSRRAVPRGRTARRSFPTTEVLGLDPGVVRRSSDYIRVAAKPTSPKHLRGRAISPKAPRPQTQTTADTDHRTGRRYGTLHGRKSRRAVPRETNRSELCPNRGSGSRAWGVAGGVSRPVGLPVR